MTKFERRGERLGHAVQDLIYLRASILKKGRYGTVQKLVTQFCRDELLGSCGRYPPFEMAFIGRRDWSAVCRPVRSVKSPRETPPLRRRGIQCKLADDSLGEIVVVAGGAMPARWLSLRYSLGRRVRCVRTISPAGRVTLPWAPAPKPT